MRIKNLYLGCIFRIDKIDYVSDPLGSMDFYKITNSEIERISILHRIFDNSNYAIDVIHGGIYHVGASQNPKIGNLHVAELDMIALCGLYAEGYSGAKRNISKKELLTYFPKLEERYTKNLIIRNGGNL